MDRRSFLLFSEHYAVSPFHTQALPTLPHTAPSHPHTDINRLHPTHTTAQLSNIQASATGHIIDPEAQGTSGVRARVLIVNNTPERGSGGYVGLMNSVFAAQKRVSRERAKRASRFQRVSARGRGSVRGGRGVAQGAIVGSVKKQGTVARSSITRMSRHLSVG